MPVGALTGTGYYEELATSGIGAASLAGGTEIMYYGTNFPHQSASLSAIFSNYQMNF